MEFDKVNQMKIVHIATTDFGGAYKATERIQACMRLYGVDSQIIVRSRSLNTDTIEAVNTPLKKLFSKSRNLCNLLLSHGEVVTDLLGIDITKREEVRNADVIVLHWVNSFLSTATVRKLAELGKPIIWVMHDMWVFTGGCHYDANCGRFQSGCGHCPFLPYSWEKDISSWNWRRKQKLFRDISLSFVAISRWERRCAVSAGLLGKRNVIWIPNPINIDIFKPMEREELRRKYRVDNKKVILYGADKATGNKTKGFQHFLDALKEIDDEQYIAVCFGRTSGKEYTCLNNIRMVFLGNIREENELAEWYNVADVFVAPSLQEAFGYTVCEALSCGTPVAAFAVGGIMDQVEHKKNGYLADVRDVRGLAEGIVYCCENRERLGAAAREHVVENNAYSVVGEQYHSLCEALLSEENQYGRHK